MSENVFDKALISDEEWSKVLIGRLSSRPNAQTAYGSGGYDAKAMKAAFDAQGNLLKERHNTLVNYARAEEGARAAAESERITAENDRKLKEQERINAETERKTAETERDKHEINRQGAENIRNEKENERQLAEDARDIAEKTRDQYEQTRMNNESARELAEKTRVNNETLRMAKDAERDGKIAKIEALVGDVDAALDSIIALQKSYIGGEA